VELRAQLLAAIARQPAYAGPLRELAEELRQLLALWFCAGLVRLERLTWGSPAGLLEKVGAPPGRVGPGWGPGGVHVGIGRGAGGALKCCRARLQA
jgi:hypothetical protein